ncbi:MAG: acyl-CoA dehydrogenase [Archangium sp.]
MALESLLQEPELRPYLPLLYLAWADGNLGSAERALIQQRIEAQPWLKPRLRVELESWLDKKPPNASTLAQLRAAIADSVKTLSPRGLQSFSALAESIAALSPETKKDLNELEQSLGLTPAELQLHAEMPESKFTSSPTFDSKQLQSVLDGRFASSRNKVREWLSDPKHRALYGVDKDTHRKQVFDWLKQLADGGFGALGYPGVTTDDTEGLGPFLVTFETLALGDLSLVIKYGVQFGLWGGSVFFLGNDAQRKKYLPKVASLEYPGCFAMSEVGHGSNVADLETTVEWDHEKKKLVLHTPGESARKDWAGNAALHAKFATVFAQLKVGAERHGVHAFVVQIRDDQGEPMPGIRIGDCGHKLGLSGVDNGRIWFDHVELPREALLGRYAEVTENGAYLSPIESPAKRFFTMLGTLVGGRIAVAASGLSAAKMGLTVALRYATQRRQFGATSEPETLLLDYPSHQRRLLPHLAATYAFHFGVEAVRELFLARKPDEDSRELEAEVAGLKAGTTWHVSQTLQACREACGGQGYLSVNRLADARADTDIFTTFEGDNTVLMQLLAKGLLTGFKKRFSEQGPVRFVANQLRDSVALTNPFTSRDTSEETLRDAKHQLSILEFREASLLQSGARRVQKRLSNKEGDSTKTFNQVQEHLLALAQAHVDTFTLRAFIDGVEKASGNEKVVLDRLRALYGLTVMERHAAWFFENGVFEPARARAIRRLPAKIFEELLPDVVALTEAFGIPDACLAAPIAFNDPAHPRW